MKPVDRRIITVLAIVAFSACTNRSRKAEIVKKNGAQDGAIGDSDAGSPEVGASGAVETDSPRPTPTRKDPVLKDNRDEAKPGTVPAGVTIATDSVDEPNVTISGGTRSNTNDATNSTLKYKTPGSPITPEQINQWVSADRQERGAEAENYRYTYIPQAFLGDAKDANYARVGLSKAINSVARAAEKVVSPEDVSDGHGVVFALNIKEYWGERAQQKWRAVQSARAKRVFSPAPRLDLRSFPEGQPVPADRLAYNLLHGGIYNQLIETPPYGNNLIRNEQMSQPTHRLGVRHAITYGPRYVQRRELPNGQGSYWESFDDFNGRRRDLIWIQRDSIPRFRRDGMVADYGTVASEAWMHMKNGMPIYFIWGNANQERTKAEQSFVRDPLNHKGGDLLTGFCVFCHISAVQTAPNDMWPGIDSGELQNPRHKEFWSSNEELTQQYRKDRDIYTEAMRMIVTGISDGDAEFNNGLIEGSDEREPCYFLTSTISGNRNRGDTAGKRRRPIN